MKAVTLKRPLIQRPRSANVIKGNLVNVIAPEPMQGFQPNFTQIIPVLGPQTD